MKNLRSIRKEKGVTQIRLSIAAEVSQETISAYESGKAFPSVETLIKMADFLETSVDYLLDRTKNSLPYDNKKSKISEKLIHEFNSLKESDQEDVLWYCIKRKEKNEHK